MVLQRKLNNLYKTCNIDCDSLKMFKVTRPSILIGTPSIFESLILKRIDLYCKPVITHVLHID